MIHIKRYAKQYLITILILSVLLRVAVAFYLGDEIDAPSLLTDQRSYHALGARLLGGHGFSFDLNWYPFTLADTPTAHWSFLYSFFVAGVYALFGPHPLAVRLVQAVLGGILLPWAVYRLAKSMFGDEDKYERSALLAALIAALYGYLVLYAATLMTETFYIIVVLWSLAIGLQIVRHLSASRPISLSMGLQLGISLGLAALIRQSILPWAPVMFLYLLWLARQSRQVWSTLRVLVIAGLLLIAFIAPFTLRNYAVYGQFLLLNSNTGYAMYSAQHPMHGTSFREFDAAPLPEGWWGRPEPELDRDLMRQAIRFVLDEPGRYLLLSLSRVRAFFEFWPTPDTTLLHNIGRVGSFGLFLPFMVYGIVLAFRSPLFIKRNGLLLLFCVFYTVLHLFTWAMVRYRLPIDVVLIPFAALGLIDLARRVRTVIPWRVCRAGPDGSYETDVQEPMGTMEN
ncbi:MAG: glycosyltransferase family 39 protein [Anaerolineae bacterium]|nr:glycosyltransferase family 39 protein [Anaerolineae bacterium]